MVAKLHKLDHITFRFKTLSRSRHTGFRDNKVDYRYFSPYDMLPKTSTMFELFLSVSTQTVKIHSRVNPSARFFFIDQKSSNTVIFNPTKLFRRWQDFFHLIFNLFFYKIDMLYFGNRVFRRQVLALNWSSFKQVRHLWSFIQPHLFEKSNHREVAVGWIFHYLAVRNFSIAFVFDIIFHKVTLYYLHKWKFYTIGSVSITHNLQNLNFALPVASDSLLMHLFFLRLISHIRRFAENKHYLNYKDCWALR